MGDHDRDDGALGREDADADRGTRASVLMVDDQPARLLTYEAILGELGHDLVRARSGLEALRLLMDREFAAILLDVNMPGMDGFETASLIRKHPRFENTPIIFVTGVHVTDVDQLKGYELGAVDYVTVPVVPEILRGKVQVLVELYGKRRELQDVNARLEAVNAELARSNSRLQEESMRELQRVNARLEAANTDLAQTNGALQDEVAQRQRVQEALQRADRRKDEFLAMLAHELRNPLSAINNGVRLIHARLGDDSQTRWAASVLDRQVRHLTRLIDDLLDVSRITTGKVTLQREPVDLAAIVAAAIETTRPAIDARGHALHVEPPATTLPVHADAVRLTQVLGNLLSNAAKYTDEGGRIAVAVGLDADGPDGRPMAAVRVRDNGIGIAEDMLEGVFELFTQADPTLDRAQGGLGIGLALARAMVELHDGTIRAASGGPGTGAEFTVRLPLAAAPGAVTAPVSVAPAPGPAMPVPLSRSFPPSRTSSPPPTS